MAIRATPILLPLTFTRLNPAPAHTPTPHPGPSSPAPLHPHLGVLSCHICRPIPIAVKSALRPSHTRQRSKSNRWPHPLATPRPAHTADLCCPFPVQAGRVPPSLLPLRLPALSAGALASSELLGRRGTQQSLCLCRQRSAKLPTGAQAAAGPSGCPDVLAGDKGHPCMNALYPSPRPPNDLAEPFSPATSPQTLAHFSPGRQSCSLRAECPKRKVGAVPTPRLSPSQPSSSPS